MDAQRHLVRLLQKNTGKLADRTEDVLRYEPTEGGLRVSVTFTSGGTYAYPANNVDIRTGTPEPVQEGQRVSVQGSVWENVVSITRFGEFTRVAREVNSVLKFSLRDSADVTLDAAAGGLAAEVRAYWQALANSLEPKDPTRRSFERLTFVHPESALGAYLNASPLEPLAEPTPAIYPFSSNISQREAADLALSHQISVIEGPPGTGKTQTILNIVASVVAAGDLSVGIVSATNSAVDNVREKLDALGVGYVAAALGNRANQAVFLEQQATRNAAVDHAMAEAPPGEPIPADELDLLTRRLRQAQQLEREQARLETEIAAYRLEHRHFTEHLAGRDLPDLEKLPLLRKAPQTILDYLVETGHDTKKPGIVTRVRRYFAYGRTRGIDPQDTAVILRLQEQYYQRRIAELEGELSQASTQLADADLDRLLAEHSAASQTVLQHTLRRRYLGMERNIYGKNAWKESPDFRSDYPVILSTCHSLANNLPRGQLLDVLIVDEASQVSLMVAAVALASARRVVVVGDTRQLPHIPGTVPPDLKSPHPAYDHREHNLLSSLHALYGEALPSTMLIEHYRCAPDIIGYCNRSFYDGRLINVGRRAAAGTPMRVRATPEGNHMRSLRDNGGTSNQREIDIIREEIIPELGLLDRQVGYIAPYRLQADKIGQMVTGGDDPDAILDISVPRSAATGSAQADTVHRFQGRECDVVVMSSVVDNSWRGQYALKRFADDARLINVAVSRAVNEFILVTHHDLHPKSRYLADLIEYIRYRDPDAVQNSAVVSIFDLLYKDYSARLKPFAARVRGRSTYLSENVAGTLISEILADENEQERYGGLSVVPQYRLVNLFSELHRFTAEQQRFIRTTSAVDFLIYRTVSLRPVLAIEVDGWSFHANDPIQQTRDRTKDSIFEEAGLPLLRLPTDGSGEDQLIRDRLDQALSSPTVLPDLKVDHPQRRKHTSQRSGRPGVPGVRAAAES